MNNSIATPPHLKALQRQWRASNPIFLLRRDLGLTRALFALWLGLDVTTLRLAEQGYFAQLPARVVAALNNAGYDGEALALRYAAWRDAFRVALQTTMPPPSASRNTPTAPPASLSVTGASAPSDVRRSARLQAVRGRGSR